MISRQLLLTIVLYLYLGLASANLGASSSRTFSGSASMSRSMNSNALLGTGGAGGAGGAGTQNKLPQNETQMVVNAVNDYEQSHGGASTAGRKVSGLDAKGNRVICEPENGIEGASNAMGSLVKKKELCMMEAFKKQQVANAVVKQAKNAKECSIKVNKRSMVCHTKKVIQDMIDNPVYELKVNGNVVTIFKKGEAILATVVEILNYNVSKSEQVQTEMLKSPTIDIKFNELGGLLSQTGEMPTAKAENPCAVCMQQLTNKANTMEGTVDDCNYSCDSNMLTSFLKPSHFKEIKQEAAPKSPDADKAAEEDGAVAA